MKRLLCLITICFFIISIFTMSVSAATTLELKVNYMSEMQKAAKENTKYSLSVGKTFEKMRNDKIKVLALDYETTNFFSENSDGKVIEKKINDYLNPPAPVIPTDPEQEILAKLLYAEAGSMGWKGQVYVCSAIMNLRDYSGESIWEMAHNVNRFAVAGFVDYVTPTQTQYDVITACLTGSRVPEIKYFRTDYYHSFGTPVCNVENVFFSK